MKKVAILSVSVIGLAALAIHPGHAADEQRSGKLEYDSYVTWRFIKTVDLGVGRGMIVEGDGFDRLVKGDARFDTRTFSCVAEFQQIGEKFGDAGSCVDTDKDGDNIFVTFVDSDGRMIGGTGKFKGITGSFVGAPLYRHVNGDWGVALIIHQVGQWQIE